MPIPHRLAALVLCLAALPAQARPPVPTATPAAVPGPVPGTTIATGPIRDVAPVLVTGVQRGPGLWKVSRGERTLWILGVVSPLPRRMEWVPDEVEGVIAASQEVIVPPSLSVDTNRGFFGNLALLPRALGARRNPDGKSLREVVPPEMYARWEPLKRRYVGGDRGIEQWRPMFAALKLYDEAIEDAGLRQRNVVWPVLERMIKRHDVRIVRPAVKLTITDPKQALDEFRATRIDDLDCFARTLQRLETDLDAMRERANAWAVGDIEALRALPYSDQNEACLRAAARVEALQRRAGGDLESRMRALWLEEAGRALAQNASTFAVLPMRELFEPDGFLAALRARGYAVQAPGEADPPADAAAAVSPPR